MPLGDFAPTGGVLGALLGAAGASLGTCAPLGAVGASLGTLAPTALGHFAPAGGAPGCASLGAFAPRWRARSRRCRRRARCPSRSRTREARPRLPRHLNN